MVEKLYWKDAYMKKFDATASKIDGNKITLDRTAFYPTGGGQLNDTGKIIVNGNEYRIIDVKEEQADITHIADATIEAKESDPVKGIIDWDRRYSLMRYHTALHIISAVVEKKYNGKWSGGMIYPDRSHMDYDFPELNRELAMEIIEDSNKIVLAARNVYSKFLTRDQALATPGLAKTKPGEELIRKLDSVRVVEIEGLDIQADGGTHVTNTQEVGKISVSKFENRGAHRKRIEIKLE